MALSQDEQQQFEKFRSSLDFSNFSTESYVRRIEKPWGYEIHFTPDNMPYMGKILHIDEDKRLSLQSHDIKQESWYLSRGNVILIIEDSNGNLQEISLQEGVGYTCALGQKHRLKGGEGGGDVFEVSTQELGNTYRLEDDFERSTETEQTRQQRNKEANS